MLADTSAWARARDALVSERWREAMLADRIVTCQPVALEVLRTAESFEDFERLDAALSELRSVAVTETTLRSARSGMHRLAARGQHRIPPFDLLVAAAAEEAGVAVLHYDAHFDLLAEVFGIVSTWLAPRGSIA